MLKMVITWRKRESMWLTLQRHHPSCDGLRGQRHLAAGRTGRGRPSANRCRSARGSKAIEGEDNQWGPPTSPSTRSYTTPCTSPKKQCCPNSSGALRTGVRRQSSESRGSSTWTLRLQQTRRTSWSRPTRAGTPPETCDCSWLSIVHQVISLHRKLNHHICFKYIQRMKNIR
jgi:hypothetical protein